MTEQTTEAAEEAVAEGQGAEEEKDAEGGEGAAEAPPDGE